MEVTTKLVIVPFGPHGWAGRPPVPPVDAPHCYANLLFRLGPTPPQALLASLEYA